MADYTYPSRRMFQGRKSQRPKTIKVWRCGMCGGTFDAKPMNWDARSGDCPTCGGPESGIVERRIKED